ncbi:MAG: BatD family protein, partial [Planctomycetales bacterium]
MTRSRFAKRFIPIFLVVAALAVAPTAARAAEVEASLSARQAYVGVPLTLHVSIVNASQQAQPEIPEIPGADVQSAGIPSRSSQTTIINGQRTNRTSITYAWQITPRRAGSFRIPALNVSVDGRSHSTRPLSFIAEKSETGDLLFVEVDGQRDRIYVGQPLDLTLKIFLKPFHDDQYDVTLSESDMWGMVSEQHSNWGAFGERLVELAQEGQMVTGRQVVRKDEEGHQQTYFMYEIPATVYPKRPGKVDTGDVQVVVQYPTSLSRSRDIFSRGSLAI